MVYDLLEKFIPGGHVSSRIVGLTTDNGSDVRKFGLKSVWTWISCFAHSLSLLVKTALDVSVNKARGARKLLAKMRVLAHHFRFTKLYRNALVLKQKLPVDIALKARVENDTRWDPIMSCISRFCHLKTHIRNALFTVGKTSEDFSDLEWGNLEIPSHLGDLSQYHIEGTR